MDHQWKIGIIEFYADLYTFVSRTVPHFFPASNRGAVAPQHTPTNIITTVGIIQAIMSLSNETDSPSDASGPLFSPFSHHNSESGDETTLSSPTVFSNNTVDNVRNPRSETERYSSVLQGLGRSPDPTPLDTHFQTPVSCHNRVLEACHARIAALEKANENLRVMVQQVNTVAQEARQTSKETAESLEINIESMEKDLGENVMPKIKNLQFRAMQTERNVEIIVLMTV